MGIQKQLRILVCPLDWGMGHTTRCVPIIQYIRESGHAAVFAGNSWQCDYITKTFGDIETIERAGYDVHYSKHGSGFMFSLFAQIPKLLHTIRDENRWLQSVTDKYKIDGVISDNRYGLYHKAVPTVFMTHQALAQTGIWHMADNMLRRLHYRYIQRFNHCWIADVAGNPNLSGKLGHPRVIPANATYIGMLSQIKQATTTEEHLLVLLSGPEPQRTLLSNILWQQVKSYSGRVVFIEGSNIAARADAPAHVTYHTRVTGAILQPLMEKARMVICRSGYSTLMDLVVLGKKAILIPTPGQTEQEYLGKHLHNEGVFLGAQQKGFNLEKVLKQSALFPFHQLDFGNGFEQYKTVLSSWLSDIQQ